MTKLQVQVPSNNHKLNLNSNIEDKSARDNSDDTSNSSYRNNNNHPCEPSDFGINSDCKLVHNPGGNDINTKDGSTHNVGDSAFYTTVTDTHHSWDCDRDKTVFTASDVDPVPTPDFAQAIPVPDVTSLCSADNLPPPDVVQRLRSLRHLAHPLDFDKTRHITSDTTLHPAGPAFRHQRPTPPAATATAATATAASLLVSALAISYLSTPHAPPPALASSLLTSRQFT